MNQEMNKLGWWEVWLLAIVKADIIVIDIENEAALGSWSDWSEFDLNDGVVYERIIRAWQSKNYEQPLF